MTYDRQIATDAATALSDLATKVSGMTGWSIVDDSSGSGYVVLGTPNNEEVGISESMASGGDGGQFHDSDDPSDAIGIQTGQNWDAANTVWGTSGPNLHGRINSDDPGVHRQWDATDSVEYWLHYSADGFFWYVRRVQGDGYDLAHGGGYQVHSTEYWDFHTANTTSGYAGYGSIGVVSQRTATRWDSQELNLRYGGEGLLNPDGNYSNYIHDDTLLTFTPAQNNDTNEKPIAAKEPDVWLRDRSGSSVGSGDVVQTSGGANEYEILHYHGTDVAISF
jgi:hypothetical protein